MYGAELLEAFEASHGAATPVLHLHSFQNQASQKLSDCPNQNGTTQMKTSLEIARRNFQRQDRRTIGERVSTRQITHALADALAPFHAKEIAEASGSSVRAAENAKQGMNAMSLAHFLNACRELPELKAMALRFMGHETEINPDRERALAMLVNSYVRGDQ